MSETAEREWEEVKEQIKDRADIVNVVEDYVSLEKKGQNYWALCPFHTEDTPSFSVNPDHGFYKCFGCGNGGDVFTFIQEIESCDFMEALRMLSERTGVDLPSGSDDDEDGANSERQNMFEINQYASERYRVAYESERGEKARQYLKERGFSDDVLDQFNVGFAPDGWDNLIQAMKRDDYDLKWAMKVGLIDKSDKTDNWYDKFRNRIMFPIETPGGRVVGFGGRILDEGDDGPKYLNSQESPIFSKRRTLYGLPQARAAIRDQDHCMIMEGYTDVIKCHQHGFKTALASLGTAMTEQHVQTLRRYADEVILVYDGDQAGRRAARRGGEIALENEMRASLVLLPEGQDPADIISESPEEFQAYLDDRDPFLDVVLDWSLEKHNAHTSDGKTEILREVIPLIKHLPGEVEREEEALKVARELDVRDDTVLRLLNRKNKKRSSGSSSGNIEERIKSESGASIEEFFFRCLGTQPDAFDDVMGLVSLKDFSDERSKILLKALQTIDRGEEEFTVDRWAEEIPDEAVSYLAGLLNQEEGQQHIEQIDPVRVAEKLKSDSARRERARLAEALEEQDENSGPGEVDEAKKSLLKQTIEMKKQERGMD